ncbi:type II toxin-antitoxin system Phd/YefM family antitoxin [Staphylococcus hominis]|uniref:type II toxin-antitoxin system Phd/YefM family antitoxin n=1 Tax=Staphylococcus hominis TaxID=1290 RepID=UPI003D076821
MNNILTPTDARKDLYNLIKYINTNHEPVFINGKHSENNAVLIGLGDWKSIQETLYLESTGTMETVRKRENDNSGVTNIDDIDWDNF